MTKEEMLRLRTNAIRHENKTGYPHLDLAHLQFCTEAALNNYDIPDVSMYGLVYERIISGNFQELVALEYFGRKITYRDFLSAINDYASAFLNIGVKKGDVVSIASPNLPEVFYSIYALNKIGAVANLIDPRNNLDRIKQFISQSHSETLIMLDIVYPKIAKIIDDTPLKKVYTVSSHQGTCIFDVGRSRHVRSARQQPGHTNVRAVLRRCCSVQGAAPLRRLRVYPPAARPVKIGFLG